MLQPIITGLWGILSWPCHYSQSEAAAGAGRRKATKGEQELDRGVEGGGATPGGGRRRRREPDEAEGRVGAGPWVLPGAEGPWELAAARRASEKHWKLGNVSPRGDFRFGSVALQVFFVFRESTFSSLLC